MGKEEIKEKFNIDDEIMNLITRRKHVDFCFICFERCDDNHCCKCSKCPISYHRKCLLFKDKEVIFYLYRLLILVGNVIYVK